MAKVKETFKDVDIRKLPKYCTPIGEATQCFINDPSKEYDEDGVYFIKLRLDASAPSTKKLLKIIDEAADAAFKIAEEKAETPKDRKNLKRADPSYKMEEDDNGVKTGNVLINFKHKAIRKTKDGEVKPYRLPLFDAALTPVNPEDVEVWGGSEVVVAFKLCPFDVGSVGVGVSHRMEAVQIIKAVAGGDGQSAESYGFAKTSGFTGAEVAEDEDDEDDEVEDGDTDGSNTEENSEDSDY